MQCVLCTLYNVHKAHLLCAHILYISKYTVLSMCTMQCIYYIYNIFIHYTGYTTHVKCKRYKYIVDICVKCMRYKYIVDGKP